MNTIFWEEGIAGRQRRALLLERMHPTAYAADAFASTLWIFLKKNIKVSQPLITSLSTSLHEPGRTALCRQKT